MKIREVMKAKGVTNKDIVPALQKVDGRINAPECSRMVGGVFNPTPPVFRALVKALGVEPSELASPEDVDYGLERPRNATKPTGVNRHYKMTVRLDLGIANDLQAMLEACGYTGPTDWVQHCYRNLRRQYKRRQKKNAPAVGAAETNAKIIPHPHYQGKEGVCQV